MAQACNMLAYGPTQQPTAVYKTLPIFEVCSKVGGRATNGNTRPRDWLTIFNYRYSSMTQNKNVTRFTM